MNNPQFAVQLNEIPAESALLTDAKLPLENVSYVPFKISKEEDPRFLCYIFTFILTPDGISPDPP